ncbi:MAG: hypothetical protein FWG74_03220 [Planctomycetes bacterium]|nr:hypothetical protein [Planctomycetota bacterium]
MAVRENVYLLADMHLKPLDAPRAAAREMAVRDNERLARFLAFIEGRASSLILLGDIFNFWFERRSKVMGDYYTALSLFKLASNNGLEIHHISGNRDYAVGEGLGFDPLTRYPGFLRLRNGFTVSRLADFGIEPHGHRFRFHQAGKTVSCIHGDSLCTGDLMFMALRWALQGPLGRFAMRWAPWSAISFLVGWQQGITGVRVPSFKVDDMLSREAVRREMLMGAELVVCGHFHTRHRCEMTAANRQGVLEVIPSWLDGWYGVMENGEVRVERFT